MGEWRKEARCTCSSPLPVSQKRSFPTASLNRWDIDAKSTTLPQKSQQPATTERYFSTLLIPYNSLACAYPDSVCTPALGNAPPQHRCRYPTTTLPCDNPCPHIQKRRHAPRHSIFASYYYGLVNRNESRTFSNYSTISGVRDTSYRTDRANTPQHSPFALAWSAFILFSLWQKTSSSPPHRPNGEKKGPLMIYIKEPVCSLFVCVRSSESPLKPLNYYVAVCYQPEIIFTSAIKKTIKLTTANPIANLLRGRCLI